MASFDRHERLTRTVEFIVPTYGKGADYRQVEMAIAAANEELLATRDDSLIADSEILVRAGNGSIVVFYETEEAS